MYNLTCLKETGCSTKQIILWILLLSVGSWIAILEASQTPAGQDIGTTVQIQKAEKEQKAMIKKFTQKKKRVEVNGIEAIQPRRLAERSQ